ncbi:MAG: hypothetical protein ABSC54_00675 [Smithellaceae bacterium]|jgi:hypothetical protein
MNFSNLGKTFLGLLTAASFRNPSAKVKRGSSLKRRSPFADLDALFTPRLMGDNYPAPSRGGNFKANQQKERKAAAKKRTIAAHRKAKKRDAQRKRRARR